MDLNRLADFVGQRRRALGYSKREAIRRAEISSNTWLKVENDAEEIADHLWAKFEKALLWESGSVKSILDGGDPVEMPEAPSIDDRVDQLLSRVERLEARVGELES